MKNLYLIIISILCFLFLGGCTDQKEINEYAYVVTMGIDKSKTNEDNIIVTFEFVIPISIDGNSLSEGKKFTSTTTVEAPSIHSAISLVNTYVSKELNLAHNKIIVFSEDMALDGLGSYVTTISNDRNFRTNMYIVISKCEAKEYIENNNPELEKNPSKYYEQLLSSYEYSGLSSNSYFLWHSLYSSSKYSQPTASIVNISNDNSNNVFSNSELLNKPNDGNYIAGQIAKSGKPETEIMGLAVFQESKQVGELTGEETLYFLMANNTFKENYYTIYDPFSVNNEIAFKLVPTKDSKIEVTFIDGMPLIKIDTFINARITSINPNIDYSNTENLDILERELEYIIETNMKNFLYKTSLNYNSDIVGFGKYAAKNFKTWDQWDKIDWLDIYKYSYFNVNVNVAIKRSGLVFIE